MHAQNLFDELPTSHNRVLHPLLPNHNSLLHQIMRPFNTRGPSQTTIHTPYTQSTKPSTKHSPNTCSIVGRVHTDQTHRVHRAANKLTLPPVLQQLPMHQQRATYINHRQNAASHLHLSISSPPPCSSPTTATPLSSALATSYPLAPPRPAPTGPQLSKRSGRPPRH